MKNILENFQHFLHQYQWRRLIQYQTPSYWSVENMDRFTFLEREGLYDLHWYAGDYGYFTVGIDELPRYDNEAKDGNVQSADPDEEMEDYEGQGLSWFLDILMSYPEQVRSLRFSCVDVGANGTRDWDFRRLYESDVSFPNLQHFNIQLYEVGDHNQSIVGGIDEDHAQHVTDLLSRMPNVVEISIPGVPDARFFGMEFPELRYLRVQAMWDGRNFIQNLSKSPLLSQISLDFMDVLHDKELSYQNPGDKALVDQLEKDHQAIKQSDNPQEMSKSIQRRRLREAGYSESEIKFDIDTPDREESILLMREFCEDQEEFEETLSYYDKIGRWDENGKYVADEYDDLELDLDESPTREQRTSFEAYRALLTSEYIKERFALKLREAYLTKEELFSLQNLNRDVMFLHIPTSTDYYVSHRMQDEDRW